MSHGENRARINLVKFLELVIILWQSEKKRRKQNLIEFRI